MLQLVTAPIYPPVSVDDAKAHLRITDGDEDMYLVTLLSAATEEVQAFTNRQVAQAVYDLILDESPRVIRIPIGPLISVESVTIDGEVFTDFEVDVARGTITGDWPNGNDVRVRFTAGYETIPFAIRAAILLIVGDLYENREAQSDRVLHPNKAVERLLWPYRVFA